MLGPSGLRHVNARARCAAGAGTLTLAVAALRRKLGVSPPVEYRVAEESAAARVGRTAEACRGSSPSRRGGRQPVRQAIRSASPLRASLNVTASGALHGSGPLPPPPPPGNSRCHSRQLDRTGTGSSASTCRSSPQAAARPRPVPRITYTPRGRGRTRNPAPEGPSLQNSLRGRTRGTPRASSFSDGIRWEATPARALRAVDEAVML